MKTRVLALATLCLALSPCVARAQGADAENCKDSALLTRMPGCVIRECSSKEFDGAALQTGAQKPDTGEIPTVALEGRVEKIHYECPASVSQLQLVRNAERALKAAGFTVVFSGKGLDDFPMLTARKGAQWVEVRTAQENEAPLYEQTAVKVVEMAQKMEGTAEAFAEEIGKSGRVAVYGITFDTGKATIKAESTAVLGQIAQLLKQNPSWMMAVEGHTDSTGTPSANAALSTDRARAVVAWLLKNGIEARRLSAVGLGDTKPVGDNATEEGRAKNRRVELVKR